MTVIDANDRIRLPPAYPAYTSRRACLSEQEEDYYLGFSNEAMWPPWHIAFVRPAFKESDWNDYRSVNARFAAAVTDLGTDTWKSGNRRGTSRQFVLNLHTQFHWNNFIETVDRLIQSRIDRELASVTVSGHETFARRYMCD